MDGDTSSIDDYQARLQAALQLQQDQAQGLTPSVDAGDPLAQPPPAPAPDDPTTIDGQAQPPPQAIDAAPAPDGPQDTPIIGGGSMGDGQTGIDGRPLIPPSQYFPNPLGGTVPNAPTAPNAPNAPTAPTARTAPHAPDAPDAPTLGGKRGKRATTAAQAGATLDGTAPAGPAGTIDGGGAANVSPAAAHRTGDTTPDGRPGIQVHPDTFDPMHPDSYKPGALEDLQKTNADPKPSHLFDALTTKNQTKYMDWWEKQHGDIEQRYAQLQQDLGARPDPQRDPTQKEKFQQLMDFGMALMAHSGRSSPYEMPDTVGAAGQAGQYAMDRQKQRQLTSTGDWDQRNAMIQGAKKEDMRELGNYGQAQREDSQIQLQDSRKRYYDDQLARANMPKVGAPGKPDQVIDRSGRVLRVGPDGRAMPLLDNNGKPVMAEMDSGGAGGAGKDTRTAVEKNYALFKKIGMSDQDAVTYSTHMKSGDPTQDHLKIFNTALRATNGDADAAKSVADTWMANAYGSNAMTAQRDHQLIPTSTPPPSTLKEGVHTKFGNGQTWTLAGGKPVQVQ